VTDESQEPGTPGYKSRKMLQAELDAKDALFAELMARVEKLESKPASSDQTQAIVDALRQDRETQKSAALQRELDEARKQLDAFRRPETPSSGVPYSGYAQARETLWDGKSLRRGPADPYNPTPGFGEVFHISMPDYWPGCPFTPVIFKGTDPGSGRPIVEPHPDFASH
jgi:hypothetical protein